ncbi:MAG: DUF6273 domain-containing protein [Candidatus Ornithomonoglobus sp.]
MKAKRKSVTASAAWKTSAPAVIPEKDINKINADKIRDFIRIFAGKSGFLNKTPHGPRITLGGLLRERILPVLGAVIVFLVSLSVLYAGENVGLSDNGDFSRVLLTNNIEYADKTDYNYLFKQNYVMKLGTADSVPAAMAEAWKTNMEEEIYSSPHFLIIKLSKELNIIANAVTGRQLTDYNIAYMALLYIFMLSVAAWVIFTFFADAKIRIQIAVFVLFIFIFCDAGYLLYFNSFYGEPLQYTMLMMLIAFGMLIYKRPSVPKVIAFYVSLYFFAGAKLANIPYSLLAAFLAILIVIMRRDFRFRIGVILSALICIVCIGGLYSSIPEWMDRDTTYQSVFLGITKGSGAPEADLEELGVDPKYAVLAGTHAYMNEDEYPIDISTPEFERDFYEKVDKLDIAMFYLHHPMRFVKELSCAIENSAYIRPPVVGNSASVPMEFTDKFSCWSHIRVALRFLYSPWVIFLAFIIITLYMIFMNIFYIYNHRIESPEKKYMICSLDVLILGLWINLALPVLCNGEGDLAKHMFLFTNCIDILFFVCILGIIIQPIKRLIGFSAVIAALTGIFYIHLPSCTVTFGTLNGMPVTWEVFEKYTDGTELLITKGCVAYMPFDGESNSWDGSELRGWLNNDFLSEFSEEEKSRLINVANDVILTYDERDKSVSGNHSHYWNFTRSLAADLAKTAYHYYPEDYVFLPTLDMMKKIDYPDSYWILCPYTANNYMERFMNKDGFILHTDVKNTKGVRAVIRIKE